MRASNLSAGECENGRPFPPKVEAPPPPCGAPPPSAAPRPSPAGVLPGTGAPVPPPEVSVAAAAAEASAAATWVHPDQSRACSMLCVVRAAPDAKLVVVAGERAPPLRVLASGQVADTPGVT